MDRRHALKCIAIIGGSLPIFPVRSQPSTKMPRVGVLWHAGSAAEEGAYFEALIDGLRDAGYVDGRNIVLEHRYPAEKPERFAELAAELVKQKVDVLVTSTSLSAFAARRATDTIPIVFVGIPEAASVKLVGNLAQPMGNVTGLTFGSLKDLNTKRIQLLKEALPSVSSVATISQTGINDGSGPDDIRRIEQSLGLSITHFEVASAVEIDQAFAKMKSRRPQAVVVYTAPLNYAQRFQIAELAIANKLPTMAPFTEGAEAGCLMSYAPSFRTQMRRVGIYVDKILKGSKPGDLPVELPTRYELVVNRKTATLLNVKIAPSFMSRADTIVG